MISSVSLAVARCWPSSATPKLSSGLWSPRGILNGCAHSPAPTYRHHCFRHPISSLRRTSVSVAAMSEKVQGLDTAGKFTKERFRIGDIDIEGISVGGQETCIILPKLGVVFDSGRCPQRSVFQQTMCLSHTHIDHISGIAAHVSSRAMQSLPATTLLMPPEKAHEMESLLSVFRQLDESDMPCEIIPSPVGTPYHVSPRHKIVPFKTFHRVQSQGYVLYSIKQKLKAGLQGLPGNEIRDRKLAGEEVTDITEVPEFAFTGDTTADFILHEGNEDVLRARVLAMELTFLDDRIPTEVARDRGHMHIKEFAEHADKFKNEAILLIHFSARYSEQQILELLDEHLPAELRAKCVPLLAGFR